MEKNEENDDNVKKLLLQKEKLQMEVVKFGDFNPTKAKEEIMRLLHEYNEVKDAAQTVIGALANTENVSVRTLHERFDLPMDS